MIRTLVRAKALLRLAFSGVARPFFAVVRPLLVRVVVPVYHALYLVRRRLQRFYRPAKNRLMYAVANRHAFHTVAIGIAIAAGIANVQLTDVRAETYGERSLMYGLVTNDEQELIDEYSDPTAVVESAPVKYLSAGNLSVPVGTSGIVSDETIVASSIVSGSTLSSLAISEASASIAPREVIETYTVQDGDTLSTVAADYGISLNTLLWANGLTVRSLVKPGQTLSILPVSGVKHTVKSGDTIARISKSYGVDQSEIIAYNRLDDTGTLSVGETLVVPGGEIQAPAPTSRRDAVTRVLTSTPTTSTTSTTKNAGASMLWPTDLSYIVRGLSWYHTGVDIDCNGHANGTSTNDNYAAADGIVQYSGWRNGYGNTVEINHGNGIVTRYGHHYSLYVQSGQSVSAGTPIGRCGSTGKSTGTHLHFEVISNGGFVNPLSYIR